MVTLSCGSTTRRGSGRGTCRMRIWSLRRGISGTRWRVWMRVASWVRVVTGTPVHMRTNFLMLTALTLSSLPWSMTLRVSSGPISERVS